jgi:glyoxylase-like metal-dependent hydrolase (beta-lactamase superfamily II)
VIQVEIVATDPVQVIKLRVARSLSGRSAYFTAAYWVDGLMIDTGCAHTAQQVVAATRGWHIDRVFNTHSHEDHIGANADIQALCGCSVLAHPDALPILANPKLQTLQPYRRVFWGRPRPSRGEPAPDEVRTKHLCFQPVHTPGHSPDHLCLFAPDQGWLFSGDAYIGGQDRALREGYDIHQIITSLKKLAELPVKTIFAGSGSVRSEGTKPLIDKIAYLEELGERIEALRAQGLSPRRIRKQLFGKELPIAYITLGHFSGVRLVNSYLSGSGSQESDQADTEASQPEAGTAEEMSLAGAQHGDEPLTMPEEPVQSQEDM